MVLAEVERALAALSGSPNDKVCSWRTRVSGCCPGLLALSGIVSENMVRDPGWYMLDSGRGLERALQITALLRATLGQPRSVDDRLVVEAVLTASESIVTFRRRYQGRAGTDAVIELLVID